MIESCQAVIRVLHIVENLEYSHAGQQVLLTTGTALAQTPAVGVLSLCGDGPLAARLAAKGAALVNRGRNSRGFIREFLDFRRSLLSFEPDILHTWGWKSLLAGITFFPRLGRVVASGLSPCPMIFRSWPVEKLLNRLGALAVSSQSYARRWQRRGISPERLRIVPPCVEIPGPPLEAADGTFKDQANQTARKVILCIGPLDPGKGYVKAVWAFDMLRFMYSNLELHVVGRGTEQNAMERFAARVRIQSGLRFMGNVPDVGPYIQRADAVWVPGEKGRGTNALLEGMAGGRPVVASRLGPFAEIVADNETGFLVPAGDVAALARKTRALLDSPERSQAMGTLGRRRAADLFSVQAASRALQGIYMEVAGNS